jgi:hypothetical protein
MGSDVFDKFNDFVIERSEALKMPRKRVMQKKQGDSSDSQDNKYEKTTKENRKSGESSKVPNKGKLKIDTTVADQQIKIPD